MRGEREAGRDHEITGSSTTEGLPVAPSMAPALESVRAPQEHVVVTSRVALISVVALLLGIGGGFIAEALLDLIRLITNVSYFGRFSFEEARPSSAVLGGWSIVVPVVGALVIGVMARFGSAAIRGHGIPEVMERVLYKKSRISPRVMFLKPLSAAVAIGTGGPFGAEGPIIATGGAFGSVVGQVLHITADERKTLLAAGAAAGMAATFGTPVSAVLLAIELLLFEYRPRSIIPVAMAAAGATVVRYLLMGSAPMFAMAEVSALTGGALVTYIVLGVVLGAISVFVSRLIFVIEDGFERLPVHWMWWPAMGAVVVGVVGYFDPRTLGVGYYNIEQILTGELLGTTLLILVLLKLVSWSVYLGSGTSGGTLAPLFIIGGGLGALMGEAAAGWMPNVGIDQQVAGLVGMAAIFAGASHAFLASVVFAFETTQQPMSLLPLLAGCAAAYLTALLMMRTSIMTEKLARRGTPVKTEYAVDYLTQVRVVEVASRDVVTLNEDETLGTTLAWLASGSAGTLHNGFPVVDDDGRLKGVVTRRDLYRQNLSSDRRIGELISRPAAVAFEHNSLREAADHMVREGVGRLVVVAVDSPDVVRGILTRSDLLRAHESRLRAAHEPERSTRSRRPESGR